MKLAIIFGFFFVVSFGTYLPCYKTDIPARSLGLIGGWGQTSADVNVSKDIVEILRLYNKSLDSAIPNHGLNSKTPNYKVVKVFSQLVNGVNFDVELIANGKEQPICLKYYKDFQSKTYTLSSAHFAKPVVINVPFEFQRLPCYKSDLSEKRGLLGGYKQKDPHKTDIHVLVNQVLKIGKTQIDKSLPKNTLGTKHYFIQDIWVQLVNGNNYLVEIKPTGLLGEPNVCLKFYKPFTGAPHFSSIHHAYFPKKMIKPIFKKKYKPCFKSELPPKSKQLTRVGRWSRADFQKISQNGDVQKVIDANQNVAAKVVGNFFFQKDVTYKINDAWVQLVNGKNYLVELDLYGLDQPVCLKYYKDLKGNLKLLKMTRAKENNDLNYGNLLDGILLRGAAVPFLPVAVSGLNQLPCYKSVLGIKNEENVSGVMGGYHRIDLKSPQSKNDLKLIYKVLKDNKENIQKLTYPFKLPRVVDVWTQVVRGKNFMVEFKTKTGRRHICLQFWDDLGKTKNVKAELAKEDKN